MKNSASKKPHLIIYIKNHFEESESAFGFIYNSSFLHNEMEQTDKIRLHGWQEPTIDVQESCY